MKKTLKIALAVLIFIIVASWIRGCIITGANDETQKTENEYPDYKTYVPKKLSADMYWIITCFFCYYFYTIMFSILCIAFY